MPAEYPERVGGFSEPIRAFMGYHNVLVPGLPKLNPGLELANTFGVVSPTHVSFGRRDK